MKNIYSKFKEIILPNGLRICVLEIEDVAWEHFGVVVHSGSFQDPREISGLAHFTEHMVGENVKGYAYEEIEDFFDYLGGSCWLGNTSINSTKYSFYIPAKIKIAKEALRIYAQMLLGSKLDEGLEREKSVIEMEFKRKYSLDLYFENQCEKMRNLFPNHRLENYKLGLGSLDSIKSIRQSDVQSFYDNHYNPSNMSIIAVGRFKASEVVELISDTIFASSVSGFSVPMITPLDELPRTISGKRAIKWGDITSMEVSFSSFSMDFSLPAKNETLNRLLTMMLNEVLFREFRSKIGSAYSVGAGRSSFGDLEIFNVGSHAISSKISNEIEDTVWRCVDIAKSDRRLFSKVKKGILNNYDMIDQNGRQICKSAMSELSEKGKLPSRKNEERNILGTAFEDVQKRLEYLRPDRCWTIIYKP